MEKLASLKPLHPEIEGFSITAGNACGVNDGAAAMVVADARPRRGERPRAAGHRPGLGVGRACRPSGRAWRRRSPSPRRSTAPASTVDDVGLWEINEAFASMCVATTRILGIDEGIVNVLGSGCSLGHPIAMTGARMVITLVHELRRRGGGTGVAAMCAGGGMSTAVVLDVPAP